VQKIRTRLGVAHCSIDDDKDTVKIENMVLTLKALGNIGNVDSSIELLNQCAKHKANPIEIRLAAIKALRRQSCANEQRRTAIWDMFNDRTEIVELRIVAFDQLVKCPSAELIDDIVERLTSETVNQGIL
jgi:hypothetical protein